MAFPSLSRRPIFICRPTCIVVALFHRFQEVDSNARACHVVIERNRHWIAQSHPTVSQGLESV